MIARYTAYAYDDAAFTLPSVAGSSVILPDASHPRRALKAVLSLARRRNCEESHFRHVERNSLRLSPRVILSRLCQKDLRRIAIGDLCWN